MSGGFHVHTLHVEPAVAPGLLVRVVDRAGHVGLGEASPLAGYSPDDRASVARELHAVQVEALPAIDLEAPLETSIERALLASGVRAPAARFALETALLDLAGRHLGRPIAALLALTPRRAVPIASLVEGESEEDVVAAARAAAARGVVTLKRKIGRQGLAFDRAVLGALRRALGPAVHLRVDANQSFPPAHAAALRDAILPASPALVEEPFLGGIAGSLGDGGAAAQLALPLAADESLRERGALAALAPAIHAGTVRAVVLKPTVLGGLFACLRLARDAVALGAAVVVTHTFEGPVALAAAAALALAVPGEALPCGLDRHRGLLPWSSIALPFLGDAQVVATDRPGLGIEAPAAASAVWPRA